MDRVQRDQCRLLINLSEFRIHRLAPRGGRGEEKREVSRAGKGGPASALWQDCYLRFALSKVNSGPGGIWMRGLESRGVSGEFG